MTYNWKGNKHDNEFGKFKTLSLNLRWIAELTWRSERCFHILYGIQLPLLKIIKYIYDVWKAKLSLRVKRSWRYTSKSNYSGICRTSVSYVNRLLPFFPALFWPVIISTICSHSQAWLGCCTLQGTAPQAAGSLHLHECSWAHLIDPYMESTVSETHRVRQGW